jgi:hypothetical protein
MIKVYRQSCHPLTSLNCIKRNSCLPEPIGHLFPPPLIIEFLKTIGNTIDIGIFKPANMIGNTRLHGNKLFRDKKNNKTSYCTVSKPS